MAQLYNWDEEKKLSKLVEALDKKALTFYSTIPDEVRNNYNRVRTKFNARFGPKEPPRTVRRQLACLEQKENETLEEFAERALQLATDGWGAVDADISDNMAMEAFLQGVSDYEAAFTAMQHNPTNIDQALSLLKKAIHDRKCLSGRMRPKPKIARSVNFSDAEEGMMVRQTAFSPKPSDKQYRDLDEFKDSMTKSIATLTQSVTQLATAMKGQSNTNPNPPGSPLSCYKCGGRGHFAKDCPSKYRGRSQSPKPNGHRTPDTSPSRPLNAKGLSPVANTQSQRM